MRFIIIGFLLINSYTVIGQSKYEVNKFKELVFIEQSPEYNYTLNSNNEIHLIITNAFVFYKKHVSSHDYGKCNFTPSCSEYALDAIKKKGIIIGIIMFFDRFSRCNGLNHKDYNIDEEKHLLRDPIE